MATDDRCSLRSLAAGEPLAGTASTIRRWLLLEHAGPWGVDPLREARIPDRVGSALREIERAAGARVLLIRRVDRRNERGITCYAVDTWDAWAGRRTLDGIEDVLELDPSDRQVFEQADGPIAVVCTHGRRDPCCAERGRPLAQALATSYPEETWESTHVGGDRFAGNLVLFPQGLYYGRVEPEGAADIIDAYVDGRIALDRFRGRARDPFPVQVAEHLIRVQMGLVGIDDVSPRRLERIEGTIRASFVTPAGTYVVTLERHDAPPMRLTCHAEREESPIAWRPVSIEAST